MKKFIIVFIILIFFCLSAQQKHKIAILNYEDRSGKIEAETLSTATDYLRMYLEGQNSFAVVPKDQQNEPASSCKDKLCRIKFGETLGAEIVAYPYIASANEQYAINVEIINVAKRSTIISVSESWNGEIDSLDPVNEEIVSKIAAKQANIDALNSNNNLFQAIDQQQQEQTIIKNAAKDAVFCEKARKKQSEKVWRDYLTKFPEGQCAAEAKTFIDEYAKKQDAEACEKAREKKNLSLWEKYLKKYPDGQCAEEAKAAPDNFACSEAEDDNSLKGWKKYLDSFPNGKCSAKARENFSNRENIEKMMKKGRDMKIAGATLFTVGVVGFVVGMSVGGYYMEEQSAHDGWSRREQEKSDECATNALLSFTIGGAIGGALLATGLPVMIVGVIKEKEAKSYLEINNMAVIPQKGGAYATIGFGF